MYVISEVLAASLFMYTRFAHRILNTPGFLTGKRRAFTTLPFATDTILTWPYPLGLVSSTSITNPIEPSFRLLSNKRTGTRSPSASSTSTPISALFTNVSGSGLIKNRFLPACNCCPMPSTLK